MIKLTGEAEIERLADRRKPTWGLFSSVSLAAATHKAKELGWQEKKVQVRAEHAYEDAYIYIVEPFENCKCPALLKFEDFFDE